MIKNKTDEEGETQLLSRKPANVNHPSKTPLTLRMQRNVKAKKSAEIKSVNSVADDIFRQTSKVCQFPAMSRENKI